MTICSDEAENCNVCVDGEGCQECFDGYFKIDDGTQCSDCQYVFGQSCINCIDGQGCQRCDDDTIRTYNQEYGLYYCKLNN